MVSPPLPFVEWRGTDENSGVPIAWMLSSNAQQETVAYFLERVRDASPDVVPKRIMSDKNHGQLNAVKAVYPNSQLLLCWWHVLHAWRSHFVTAHHPELWELLKGWVRITGVEEFDQKWEAIQRLAPQSVTEYLRKEWIPDRDLWSAVARKDRSVWELGDTNMLVEA
jgi:hypothetical protein